ncbi:hypothetical protein PGC34_20060 [Pseudomonas kribbensis]|uniref:hypothetical protein n=1 Tax=Pseudomonas kribbensis TaxID=1628086 RepID=UPI003BF8204D
MTQASETDKLAKSYGAMISLACVSGTPFFRQSLVAGDFFHYDLTHVECFYGTALISAYLAENDIPLLGLFIDRKCAGPTNFFRLEPFNTDCYFVYFNHSLA